MLAHLYRTTHMKSPHLREINKFSDTDTYVAHNNYYHTLYITASLCANYEYLVVL